MARIHTYVKTLTAGTPVSLHKTAMADSFCRYISIQATSANASANVFIGGQSMTSTDGQHIARREAFVVSYENDNIDVADYYAEGATGDTVQVMRIIGVGAGG